MFRLWDGSGILRLFPAAELTIGPVVADGFYYDIHLPEGKLTPDDFPALEEEMGRIAKEALPFQRSEVEDPERDEAFARYRAIDGGQNKFKAELVEEISGRGDDLSFYRHGDFVDLCRGPHVQRTDQIIKCCTLITTANVCQKLCAACLSTLITVWLAP